MFVTIYSPYETYLAVGMPSWDTDAYIAVLWFDSSALYKTVPPAYENIRIQLTCLPLQNSFGASKHVQHILENK